MDSPEVAAIARTVANVGKGLAGDGPDMVSGCGGAEAALRGSVLCARVNGLSQSYAGLVTDLAEQVTAFSADLLRTVNDFRAADTNAATRIHRSAGRGPR